MTAAHEDALTQVMGLVVRFGRPSGMHVEQHDSGLPPSRDALLKMRVSEVLALHDAALDVLIAHGFTPLAQTHLRSLLAPTVTLAQAARLKSLGPEQQDALIAELLGLLDAEPVKVGAG